MTFVYEKLSDKEKNEIRKKIPKFQPIMSDLYAQVIDRDRDLLFVDLGGRGELPPSVGEPPDFYAMFWRDLCITFEGHYTSDYSSGMRHMTVQITKLQVPQSLQSELPKIEAAIEEAMTIFWNEIKMRPGVVTVQFPQPTYY